MVRHYPKKFYDPEKKVFERPTSEEDTVKAITAMLRFNGLPVWRIVERIPVCPRCNHRFHRVSERGIPDLAGVIPIQWRESKTTCLPFFLEVKSPVGEGTKDQIAFLEQRREDGAIAMIVRSWEDVKTLFNLYGFQLEGTA